MNKPYNNVNYAHLSNLLMPIMLRLPILTGFVRALIAPLQSLQQDYADYVENLQTGVRSQVCRMEYIINERFDFDSRRIRVQDSAERKEADFKIVFPEGYFLTDSRLAELKILVNQNKLAAMQFVVVGYYQ